MNLRRFVASSFPLLAAACGPAALHAPTDPKAIVDSVSKDDLARLSKRRIYFGHQSVGYNVVAGLAALEKDRPDLGLVIKEKRDPAAVAAGVLAHARNGQNEAPLTKIQDFARTMESGMGKAVDTAFFKFCYVDFQGDTDVDRLFGEYKPTLARRHQQVPDVTFVHVTTPLSVVQTGPKATLKRIRGRKRWGAGE